MNKRKDVTRNNLKEYRNKCGYTQKEVANILGITAEDRRWEQGTFRTWLTYSNYQVCIVQRPAQMYSDLMKRADDKMEVQNTNQS